MGVASDGGMTAAAVTSGTQAMNATFGNEDAQKAIEEQKKQAKLLQIDVEKEKTKMALVMAKLKRAAERVSNFMKSFMMIARFYPIIVLVLIILAFFGKPLEYIMLFVSAIIVTILFGIVYILGIDYIRVVPFTLYNIVVYLVPLLAYTVIIFLVFLIVSLIILFLAGFNMAFSGILQDLLKCQNSPEAWFKTPNYHLKNEYSRGFFCGRPCMARYKPDGANCKKMIKQQSSYCAIPEIMRIFTGYSRSDAIPYFLNVNTNDFRYLSKQPHQREAILKNNYLNKVKYITECNDKAFQPFFDMTLNMCSSIDTMTNSGKLTSKQADVFRTVCKQAYCTSISNYPFCAKPADSNSMNGAQFVKQLCKIFSILIVFFLVLIMALKFIFEKDDTKW